jgi:outer membrane lipoprotein-sorting protein
MLNKKFFIIVFLFFTCSLFAQNAAPQVAPIIEKTVQKYNALSAFSIDFKMSMENNKKNTQSYEGVLFVKKDKYYLTFEDQIIANDGEIMWNYQKSINEASLFEAEDDDLSIFHPAKMLSNWNKEYDAKFIREEEFQKKQTFIVDLRPKKRSSFYKIRLFIDKNTSYIQQIMMYEMDETTITYTISKFTPNATVADTKFIFNKNDYPDVQINDMR